MTDDEYKRAVGARLKQARIHAGFKTAASAAESYRWHKQNVADHEAGRRGVDTQMLDDYSKKYGVLLEWLAFGRGPMTEEDATGTIDFWAKKLDGKDLQEVVDFAKFKATKKKDVR